MWQWVRLSLMKNHPLKLQMLGLSFSSKLDRVSHVVSIAKTASRKFGALIRFMTFFSSAVALCYYKSTKSPCMEYCCHAWACDPIFLLNMSGKLHKRVCSSVDSTLVTSLKPLTHRKNEASLSRFYRYYFIWCTSEIIELVPPPYSRDRFICYCNLLHDFSITVPWCYVRCQYQQFLSPYSWALEFLFVE